MSEKAQSIVAIMIIIALAALVLRFAIDQAIRFNINQNESTASATLKLVAAALETYAKDHQQVYPTDIQTLTTSSPRYLDKDYTAHSPFKGYVFSCSRLDAAGYSCEAMPLHCRVTGSMVYSVSTGAVLAVEECGRKEKEQ